MEQEFIGRRDELRVLQEAFTGQGSAFIPIYGRRRVGKSELVLRFMAGKRGSYLAGKQAPARLHLRELLAEAATLLGEPLLADHPVEGWKDALSLIHKAWKGPGKLILALDEFQWIAQASPELPSVIQELWDRVWRRSGNVVLILCGSYVGFMERAVLGRQSPLFGRRTAQIHLKPFGYREAAQFHPGYSIVDKARVYFLCGGVPLYLRCFSPRNSVEANTARCLLDPHGPLFAEPDFLLREELRDVENYSAILVAIASGFVTNRQISAATGIGERSLHYYLEQLVQLGYLQRRYPLTGAKPAARHVRYEIGDPLLRFWFRFVFPSTSLILRAGPERALKDLIRPHLDSYFGRCFEHLCREALAELYVREGVGAFEVGQYWDKTTQIDVVGLRRDGWTDLGECKWGEAGSLEGILVALRSKGERYPNPRNATIGYRLFVRRLRPASRRWSERPTIHTLEDLYSPI
jgi:hypothetical protein